MSTTKRDYNTLHSYASKAYKITKSSDQIRDWSKDTWNALKRLKVKNDMNNFERTFNEEIGKLNAILTEQQEQKKKKMERSTISRFLISKPNNKKIAKPIKKDKQEMDGSDDEKDDHKDNVSNTNNARAQQTKKVRRFSELSPQPQSHAPPEKKQKIMQTPQKKHQTPAIDRLKSKIGILKVEIRAKEEALAIVDENVVMFEGIKRTIRNKQKELHKLEQSLKKRINNNRSSARSYAKKRSADFKEDEAQDDELPLISNAMMCDWVKNRIPNELIHEQDLI
eukprot:1127639_1